MKSIIGKWVDVDYVSDTGVSEWMQVYVKRQELINGRGFFFGTANECKFEIKFWENNEDSYIGIRA